MPRNGTNSRHSRRMLGYICAALMWLLPTTGCPATGGVNQIVDPFGVVGNPDDSVHPLADDGSANDPPGGGDLPADGGQSGGGDTADEGGHPGQAGGAPVPLERIALTGDVMQSFERAGQATYSPILAGPFYSARGNAAGQVTFTADAAPPDRPDIRYDVYIGLFDAGSLHTVAYEYSNNAVDAPPIDSAGRLIVPASTGRDWLPGSRRLVGDTGPFQTTRANMNYRAFQVNARDEVLFPVAFETPFLEGALYVNTGSLDVKVAADGESAIGFPGEVVYDYFVSELGFGNQLFRPYLIGPGGHILFVTPVRGPGVSDSLKHYGSVWLAQPGGEDVALVARIGQRPPGISDGGLFDSFGEVALGPNGEVAFIAEVGGDRTTEVPVYRGIWATSDGILQRITTSLDLFGPTQSSVVYDVHVGYTPDGTLVGVYRGLPQPSRRDETLDELVETVYYGPLKGLRMAPVAELGGPAPGGGVFSRFHDYALASSAQAALVTARFDVEDGTVDRRQGDGLWVGAPGDLRPIVRGGDRILVTPDDARIVKYAHVIGDHEGASRVDLFLSVAFAEQLGVRDVSYGLYRATLSR